MESLVHYNNPSHAPLMLGVLNEQRLRGQLCDTVLVVGDQRYQAHRSVLAGSSEYFQSLFTRMEGDSLKVIHLDFCEPDAFEIVLNYIYSSSLLVDKGSLAAVQELGYSLGIPFLTNIISTRPHVSYCVSRKRLSFSEEDETDSQTRSVIVCRVRSDTSVPSRSNHQKRTSEKSLAPRPAREQSQPPSEQNSHHEAIRNSESIARKSEGTSGDTERKSVHPYSSILKGKTSYATSVRPQLTSSVSFSDAELQHIRLQPGPDVVPKEETEEQPLYNPKRLSQAGAPSQTIDRSGPLIKSLLRRSLSMDSPVPVFSPTLELRELQSREQSVVKMVSKASGLESSERNNSLGRSPSLVLKSESLSRSDEGDRRAEAELRVKAEPSSPLPDPMEIIQITVGDNLPVGLNDFQTHYDHGSKLDAVSQGKRKARAENRRHPFKKIRAINEHHLPPDENMSASAPRNSSKDNIDGTGDSRRNKIFKCWNCLKVFRSNAGLHRHVNMYHNPEKPYSCDICHKRFHTNFKVWTHSQTQHGILQNPASSSSSSVLDDKFQKKLMEIKKALLWKLKRNKQGLQSPTLNKKRSKNNFVCPYCGKGFLFQSQYKQHLRTHPSEIVDQETERETAIFQKQDRAIQQNENADAEVYSCRLCSAKLSSLFEQGDHERGCRHATVCPYCGLRFSNPAVKKDHEAHCKYKKLTCLECMRTFKSSFSIWRHQVEVHNHNMMTVKEQMNLKHQENNGEVSDLLKQDSYIHEPPGPGTSREDTVCSDSSGAPIYDSEDSSSYVPEDLSLGKLVVKEEPIEEPLDERETRESSTVESEETDVWPCEKCGKLFSSHKDLERHQELLCHIKPFICHVCNKAFRTNFRLWSHFQSHMSAADEAAARELERRVSSPSPSPPPTPQASTRPTVQAGPPGLAQPPPGAAGAAEEPLCPDPPGSSEARTKTPEVEGQQRSHSPLSRSNSAENPAGPQESDTLFYNAPTLSALTFKRQYMCKLCHRTFKTAFSLWSHEQSHSHL